MVLFSSLFLLDSATLFVASMATVVYGYVDHQEFCFCLWVLFLACGGSHWALYTPSWFLLVCMFVFVSCGCMESERLHFCLKDLFFALCGGSLWALYTPEFCFFCPCSLSFFCLVFGSDGAKRGLYTALVCSHASRHVFFRPANFLIRRVDS